MPLVVASKTRKAISVIASFWHPRGIHKVRAIVMSSDDTELLKEFAVESQEHLSDIENQLLTLESQGDAMDVALVNTVFRAIHSIKGAAGFMGLDTLGGLAHRAEEVLGRLRSSELRPTSVVINTLLRATDRLKELIDEIENSNGQDVSSHITALEDILEGRVDINGQLPSTESSTSHAKNSSGSVVDNHVADSDVIEQPEAREVSKQEQVADNSATSESENPTIEGISSNSAAEAIREYLVESFDNLEQVERDLLILERDPGCESVLNNVFRNMHTIKGSSGFLGFGKLENVAHAAENLLAGVRAGQFAFDAQISESLLGAIDTMRKMLFAVENNGTEGVEDHQFTVDFLNAIFSVKQPKEAVPPTKPNKSISTQNFTAPAPVQTAPVVKAAVAAPVAASPATNVVAPKSDSAKADKNSEGKSSESKNSESKSSANAEVSAADSTIRVDVALLDKLMTRVGELVLARNQILQFNSKLNDAALQNAVQRLNLITSELQEGVMKTRMQPIGNVWTKFPRLVRDLATMCEKQVRIEMEGKETELDKTIIEAIKDPLTHLVRNTVDHGIEKPEVRRQVGKPIEGCLTLKAYHEGGQVNIEIVDDGGGLNIEKIKSKAVEKGLISADEAARMPDREVGNLIFLPGFSTADKVSSVSGRGVGMDVVKTNIEKIGGTVDLQSQQGKGTTIKIKIPLTLAIIPALIVSADGDRYAIPQVNLLELVRLENQIEKPSIEWIQGAPVYRLRGQLLPLIALRHELDLRNVSEPVRSDCLNIVVLRADDRQFGLVVDKINDSEEIVVKPLSKQLKNVPIYAGTTIMGDGRVALILDVMGLAHSAHVISGPKDRGTTETAEHTNAARSRLQTLLVMQVGADRKFALPLSQVTRLEKIQTDIIEIAGDQEVVQYRGEILPLIRLSNCMGVVSVQSELNLLDVVVYTKGSRSVGLVVDQITDIVETDVVSQRSSHRPGLTCSAVVQGHITDVLDLPTIIQMADPSFFNEMEEAPLCN